MIGHDAPAAAPGRDSLAGLSTRGGTMTDRETRHAALAEQHVLPLALSPRPIVARGPMGKAASGPPSIHDMGRKYTPKKRTRISSAG